MGYTITCDRCDMPVTHTCNADLKEALLRLLTWAPDGYWASQEIADAFKAESERQGDEYDFQKEPFFGSQAWSYLIWHKEEARTFHALLFNVMRGAGIDPNELTQEANKIHEASMSLSEYHAWRDARSDVVRTEHSIILCPECGLKTLYASKALQVCNNPVCRLINELT